MPTLLWNNNWKATDLSYYGYLQWRCTVMKMQQCNIFNGLAAWYSRPINPDKSPSPRFLFFAAGEKTNWGSPTAGCVTWPLKSSSSSLRTQRRTSFPSPNSQMSLLLGRCPLTWCPSVCLSRQYRSLMLNNHSPLLTERGLQTPNICVNSMNSYLLSPVS